MIGKKYWTCISQTLLNEFGHASHAKLVCGLMATAILFLWLVRHRPQHAEAVLRPLMMGLAIAVGATCVFLWMQYFGF